MSDRDEIEELQYRYADAVCHDDATRWAECWTEDGVWDTGGGAVEGRAAVVAAWTATMAGLASVVHLVHQGTTIVHGNTGTGRWYITEHVRIDGSEPITVSAHYDDEYRKVDGRWCFSRRELHPLDSRG